MKRSLSKLIITVLMFVTGALMLCACNDIVDGIISLNYTNESAYTVASEGELSVSAIGLSIDVEWINGGVTVNVDSTLNGVRFHEVSEGEKPNNANTMRYLYDGNTLRIKYAKSGRTEIGKLKKFLYVSVPANVWLADVDIETKNGNVIIENVNANKIECETVSASVSLNCTAHMVETKSVSGSVSIRGGIADIDVETDSGLTSVFCDTALNRLSVDSVSGDVELGVFEQAGFKLSYDTVSGVFINAFSERTQRQGKFYVYNSGNSIYEIDTVSGKLTIEEIE